MEAAEVIADFDHIIDDVSANAVALVSPIIGALPFRNLIDGEVTDANKITANFEFIRSQVNSRASAISSPIVGPFPNIIKNNAVNDADDINENFTHLVDEINANAVPKSFNLFAWGDNNNGQLGNGVSSGTETSPIAIGLDPDWVRVRAGGNHTIAIQSDGTMHSWGNNTDGQLGLGDTTERTSPVQIGTDNDWVHCWASTSGGGNGAASAAIKSDGRLFIWGDNVSGQLGLGDTVDRDIPTQVGSDTDWSFITIGIGYQLAVKTDGRAYAWGFRSGGQLGLNNPAGVETVVTQIGSDTDWLRLYAANSSSQALKTDGTLHGWGFNSNGSVGDGTTTQRNVPVQIGSDTDWVGPGKRGEHTIALKTGGTAHAWGSNNFGQLGLGDTAQRNSPVQIGSDIDWSLADSGDGHSLLLKTNNTLYASGRNNSGQLGLGDTSQRTSFVQVGTDTDWVFANGGGAFSNAFK